MSVVLANAVDVVLWIIKRVLWKKKIQLLT